MSDADMPPGDTLESRLIAVAFAALGTHHEDAELQRHRDNLSALIATMLAHGRDRHDPVRTMTACMGDRWTPLLMNLLSGGPMRFGELRRLASLISVEGEISQHVLTMKLRNLERDGLVLRTVVKEVLLRSDYALTELGHHAYKQYLLMMRWAEDATPRIRAARQAYDRLHGAPADDDGD
jgi:DNA-binding HxlR family transcriptional regulator